MKAAVKRHMHALSDMQAWKSEPCQGAQFPAVGECGTSLKQLFLGGFIYQSSRINLHSHIHREVQGSFNSSSLLFLRFTDPQGEKGKHLSYQQLFYLIKQQYQLALHQRSLTRAWQQNSEIRGSQSNWTCQAYSEDEQFNPAGLSFQGIWDLGGK